MGTITPRKRLDGSVGYTVQIRVKRGGRTIYTESRTFDRAQAAKIWNGKREAELAEPGALERLMSKPSDVTLAKAIDKYLESNAKAIGKTKAQVLRTIQQDDIGQLSCSQVNSQALLEFLDRLPGQPQTKGNYLSHIGSVMRVAKAAWGYPLEPSEHAATVMVAKHLGKIGRSNERDRRPTLDELHTLLTHFDNSRSARSDSIPMVDIMLYAIFSTRRMAEITRQTFSDLEAQHSQIWVRDMKHPGEKLGNDVRVTLPPEALALVLRRQRQAASDQTRIFPHNESSVSAAFTRACTVVGIDDLHFHDLRHEGISRLFEMGQSIPQVAQVSGHRSWTSLKRYTHIRQTGDKYAGWPWLARLE